MKPPVQEENRQKRRIIGVMLVLGLLFTASRSDAPLWASPPEDLAALLRKLSETSAADTIGTRTQHTEEPTVPAPDAQIASFCGDCHAIPKPESFERAAWYEKIRKGFEFYARSQRKDLEVPSFTSVLRYYLRHAPERIQFADAADVDEAWANRFEQTKLDWQDGESYSLPAVSSLLWTEKLIPGVGLLVVSDMRDGSVSLVQPAVDPSSTRREVLTRLSSPARTVVDDLDEDGHQDLIISDLGSLNPYDHAFGKVVWMQKDPQSMQFRPRKLLESLGRVADLAVGDFDEDGTKDVLVAEFGHRQAGGIRLLTELSTNEAEQGANLSYEEQRLDIRPGTVRFSQNDWDGDGRPDFAALVSQEYESLDLFLNRGFTMDRQMAFDRISAGSGGDLSFGSVALHSVDLDGDGDLDFLTANGDCFDDNYAHLSHGIRWYENIGPLEFRSRTLLNLPGAYQVASGDFDQDDDLDIVVVANLPANVSPQSLQNARKASIVMLEQIGSGEFVTHVLEHQTARYATLECGDFNADGKTDFAVGALLFGNDEPGSIESKVPRLTIWWNRG